MRSIGRKQICQKCRTFLKTKGDLSSDRSYDDCCNDVEQVDNGCCDDKREPDLLYAELPVLAELVVKGSRNVLEENDLLPTVILTMEIPPSQRKGSPTMK